MPGKQRPNVLLIMSDQHRGDCLDFVARPDGQQLRVQTPHLRRLAEEGICFRNCYSESPVCVPARALLQTGILPHRSGIFANGDPLPANAPTLAGCLAANGYFTQAIGKMHFRPVRAHHGLQRLWLSEEIPYTVAEDEFLRFLLGAGYGHVEEPNGIRHEMYLLPQVSQLPETHHTTAWTGRETIRFLREQTTERREQPFFCWTSFQKPHPPFEPPVPWHRLYQPSMAPAPVKSDDELRWLPTTMGSAAFQQFIDQFPDYNRLATMWSYYFSAISFIDSWIGMLLDELERLALRENTLVLYVSDHGEHMGDHWTFGKSTFYDAAAHVPAILSWPAGLPQGKVRRQLVGLTDVAPTILDAAGVDPAPFGLRPDGLSLLPAAREDAPTRPVLIGQVGKGASAHLAALNADWKYVYAAGDNRELLFRRNGPEGELRNELVDPSREAAAAAEELRATLQQRYRHDGATEALDEHSPNGFRLLPARNTPDLRASDPEVRHTRRMWQYARWIRELPEGWTPPPASEAGSIPADQPPRSDRSRYTWARMLGS